MRGSPGRSLGLTLALVAVLLPALLVARAGASPLPSPSPQDAAPPAQSAAKPPKGLGEAPPALEEVEWIQGKPLKQYKRGDIYVINFLSAGLITTPHVLREMAALQDKYAQDRVQVVCLFVAPDPRFEPPAVYMKRRPEAAKLAVARDKGDATLGAFRKVVGDVGGETAVVVDKKGRIAWHGEVFTDLGPAIAAVVADDTAALGKLVEGRQSIQDGAKPHGEALNKSMRAKQWDKVVAAVDGLLALDAKGFGDTGVVKYQALVSSGKKVEAAAWGRQLVEGALHEDEGQLNNLAWFIVDPAGKLNDSARDLELALAAAERGCELSNQLDAPLLDTLARAHWRLGHRDQAIELQKKAVELAFGSETKSQLQKALDEYLKPPAPKPDVPAEGGAAPPAAPPATPDPPGGTPVPPPPPPGGEPKR